MKSSGPRSPTTVALVNPALMFAPIAAPGEPKMPDIMFDIPVVNDSNAEARFSVASARRVVATAPSSSLFFPIFIIYKG
jgi:hypothetical protein